MIIPPKITPLQEFGIQVRRALYWRAATIHPRVIEEYYDRGWTIEEIVKEEKRLELERVRTGIFT